MRKLNSSCFLWFGVTLVVALLYLRVTSFDFIFFWDDGNHLLDNPFYESLSWQSFLAIWQQPYFGLYIPVTYSVWWIQFFFLRLFEIGNSPFYFHLASVLLHLVNALLVIRIVSKLTGRSVAKLRVSVFLAALFFALHPIQAESVAWVSAQRDLLSTMFLLFSFDLFLADESHRSRLLGMGLFIVAILSKPSAVVLPFLLLAYFFSVGRLNRKNLVYIGSMVFFAMVTVLITKSQQGGAPDISIHGKVVGAVDALLFYFKRVLLLERFHLIHGSNANLNFNLVRGLSLLAVISLFIIFFFFRNSRRVLFPLVFSIISLLPVLGFVPFTFQTISGVADRYAYLPMVGISSLISVLLASRCNVRSWLSFVMVAVLVVFFFDARKELLNWKNGETLFAHALSDQPENPVLLTLLGQSEKRERRCELALEHFHKSLTLLREHHTPWEGAAECFLSMNRPVDLLQAASVAYQYRPERLKTAYLYGKGLELNGEKDKAREVYEQALSAVNPQNPTFQLKPSEKQTMEEIKTALASLP